MHNPNPFDFVPFAAQPVLKTEDEFNTMGDLFSGYLEVKIKALTPVHIVGYQNPDGSGRKSHIYQQNNQACIPAASIRGCLRAFMEALTAGWVSEATAKYKKVRNERHVGFSTFEQHINESPNRIYTKESAVDSSYKPQTTSENEIKLDIPSFLFGIVAEKEKNDTDIALARKSRVWIEDAFIDSNNLDGLDGKYWIPDIAGKAIMGGANPRASNWWYMEPKEIWQRNVTDRNGNVRPPVAEFIGEKYWGRKFYYHQNPEKCVRYYEPQSYNWPYKDANSFCKVKIESIKPQASTNSFRVYVNRIPKQLLVLLVLSLLPGSDIRHKIGYGKAYGYGSIEFSIQAAHLRIEDANRRIPNFLQDMLSEIIAWSKMAWNPKNMQDAGFEIQLIDWQALKKIATILGWENADKLIFTYPPFPKGYLFGVTLEYQRQLDLGSFSDDLRKEFSNHNISLTQNVSIKKEKPKEKPFEWTIFDNGSKYCNVRREGTILNIYGLVGNFATPIPFEKFKQKASNVGINVSQTTPVSASQAREIAMKLSDIKKPIHFQIYQENALGWEIIRNRKP